MTAPLTLVDSFTSRAFGGNPAAVCVLPGAADETWMRLVARELAMPATAFLHPDGDGYRVRWLTTAAELELCGHGTLASAHVLWESGRLPRDRAASFQTRNGPLSARWKDGWIVLDFPALPPVEAAAPIGLLEILGVTPSWIGRSRLDYIVEVGDERIVRELQPDFVRLRDVQTRGVIVTSRSASPERDFVSRFFAPSTGLNEDSATGSAHCCLAPYWASRLGRTSLVAHQISPRGGVLKVAIDGDRVRLEGQAVTVMRGEISTV
jgi:predicted PhzF superfamily epimerase YddE/YHI9